MNPLIYVGIALREIYNFVHHYVVRVYFILASATLDI